MLSGLILALETVGSEINSWIIRLSSMLTIEDTVGLKASETSVQRRATLIITITSSLSKSDPNLGSTSSIRSPFSFKACAWKERIAMLETK